MFRKRSRSVDDGIRVVPKNSLEPKSFVEHEKTLVWRFPLHISQSSIGGKTNLSNACTLIALKIAELIHFHNIDMPIPLPFQEKRKNSERVLGGAEMTPRMAGGDVFVRKLRNLEVDINNNELIPMNLPKCPPSLINCLVNGIIDGNEAYSKDAGIESTRVYNLPDAIKACDDNLSEIDFKLSNGCIGQSLPKLINLAVRCPMFQAERRLMFVMIGCVRTVLIVFDRNSESLTLFDTHMHTWYNVKHGALIGTCPFSRLNDFADWVRHFVFPETTKTTEEFEISLVQLTESGDQKARGICKTARNFSFPIRFPVFQTPSPPENKENRREFDYPVLRSILSKPPLKTVKIGEKRHYDSKNGEESGSSGRRMKEIRLLPT